MASQETTDLWRCLGMKTPFSKEWIEDLKKEAAEIRLQEEMNRKIDADPEYQRINAELEKKRQELMDMIGVIRGKQKALRFTIAVKISMTNLGKTKDEAESYVKTFLDKYYKP